MLKDLDGLVLLMTDPVRAESALAALRRVEPERAVLAVIEDIDAMLGEGREERLLSFLDGKTQIDHVLFIATTNSPERLDQRLRARPSRFDRVHVIGPPSVEVRRAYLEKRLSDLSPAELDRWVELSEGFTIAYLEESISRFSALVPIRRKLPSGCEQTSLKNTQVRTSHDRAWVSVRVVVRTAAAPGHAGACASFPGGHRQDLSKLMGRMVRLRDPDGNNFVFIEQDEKKSQAPILVNMDIPG
jgi:hypothetical protein